LSASTRDKLGTPTFVLERIGVAYDQYTRPGKITATEVQSQRAIIDLTGVIAPLYMCAQLYPGWLEAAVDMSGVRRSASRRSSAVTTASRAAATRSAGAET
jgi:hypothetical protein